MRPRFEFASRFRILKGGKISLIVSALVTSVTLSFASPSGGVVTSGSATINQSGIVTNINQSTSKASINWTKFNIARDETVNFKQPNINSITLNRVIGNERSIINGALNANGQVWILNSNGVLFGKNASVNTSGLLATTASLSDEAFQAGAYHFKNATSNSIINEGTIKVNNSSYVILASNETRNTGSIEAVKAKVHLVGANEYSINLNGNSLVDLTIEKGVMDALVENSGTIINKAGEIYLTTNAVDELLKGVVNHTGIIEANSLDEITGKVELFAHGGEVQVGGTIKASEGFVETSGKDFKILDNATIEAGKWLIDPVDITIDATLASTIETALTKADVTIETTSSSSSVDTSSNEISSDGDTTDGDIYVNSDITWSSTRKLTLTADDEIYVNATIENTNDTNGGVYFNAANTKDKVIFGTNGKVIINNVYQLQWINQALNGTYELSSNINASATSTWNSDGSDGYYGWDPIGDNITSFTGTFDGNGHAIDVLYINKPNENYVGLFGDVGTGGTVINIGLTNVAITGKNTVGGLVGVNDHGEITNSYATGSVSGDYWVGGLVGYNDHGEITNSYATGSVSGDYWVGGLVGNNTDGTIKNSYATGSVSGDYWVGGLVGNNTDGTIKNSYATGSVSGDYWVGGLVGNNTDGTIKNSYATGSVSGIWYVGGLVGGNYGIVTNSYATGSVDGNEYVGGLVGYNREGTITNSYATGSVDGDYVVGGLVGYKGSGTITNSYATGSVDGNEYVGGLVGRNYDEDITNSYAIGSISGTSNVGGLVGYKDSGTITKSYWDTDTSGQSSSDGGTGLTTEQFADPTYFLTWDSSVWQLGGGSSIKGYGLLSRPYLKDVTIDSDKGTTTTLFASGWGTEVNPYTITTWAQLANIDYNSETLSYHYDLLNNLTTSTTGYSTYASSSANGGLGWDPIGDNSNKFTGSFDGNDYTIDSLYINRSSEDYVGLFGYVASGSNRNVGLTNVDIIGKDYVGGLVGNNYGTITNSYVIGSVDGGYSIGGLVGRNHGTVSNSYFTGDVHGTNMVGGLFAYNGGTISNAYSTGSVSGDYWVGGLVGENEGTIENSYSVSNVEGDNMVGGLVGYMFGTISNSYSIGKVTGLSNVGGLVGIKSGGIITNSYWDTDASGQTDGVGAGDNTEVTGLTTEQMAYGKIFSDAGWDIEVDTSLTSGNAPVLRYNADGSASWIIAPLTLSYTLTNPTAWTYDGISYNLSSFYNDSASLFGSDYDFIDSSGYSFIDGSNSTITSVRNAGTYTIGLKSENSFLSMASTGNIKATIKIDPKVLSASYSANDKIYDGTTTATVSGSLDGDIISGDKVSLLSQSANFEDKNAGSNKQINITNIILSGNDALNYTLTSPTTVTTSATINKKEITATYSADDKTYDGTTLANVNGSLVDAISGDSISLMQNANYIDKNAGSNKQVNITNIALNGDDALNYTLTSPTTATTSANINQKEITAIYIADDKTYDGTTLANVNGSLSDVISGDSVSISHDTANFEDKNAGSNKQVNITNIALNGNDASNYTLTSPTTVTTSATINKKEITATYSADDKIYDGTTTATVSGSLDGGIISGDSVSLLNQSANFEDKNAGENKQVNITNIALSGNDALNYVVSDTTTNATINKKEITATYSADDKTYDGTTLANVNGSLVDAISGDSISLMQNANYIDKNVGSNKQVNITNIALSGNDALNYALTSPTTATTSANINKKGITAIYTAEDKTYDGTTLANVSGSLSDVISGDSVSLLNQSANFEDKNAGENKQVNITNIALSGNDALNYTLISPTTATTNANINQKEITANYSANDKTYDGTTLANVSGSLSDVISGDSVSISHATAKFADKNAGENKQVNITNIALSGDDALNYVVSDTTTSATINKKEITATYSADDKTYDGTILVNVNGSLVDAISGDSISLMQNANYIDKNAGSNKQVNITNIALNGNDALNYTLTSPTTATTNANINKKRITATYSADDKTYDGTTLANVNGSLVDAISGDSISLMQNASFEDEKIGNNKQINISNILLKGTDSLNYSLLNNSAIAHASILEKPKVDRNLLKLTSNIIKNVEEEHKIKNRFIHFNPIRKEIAKEIVLEIINGGIKLPKTVMTQSSFFNDSDNKGDEI